MSWGGGCRGRWRIRRRERMQGKVEDKCEGGGCRGRERMQRKGEDASKS